MKLFGDNIRKTIKLHKSQKFNERNVLLLLEENGYLSAAMIQKRFFVGYAQAAQMLDSLVKKKHIRHNGQTWAKVK